MAETRVLGIIIQYFVFADFMVVSFGLQSNGNFFIRILLINIYESAKDFVYKSELAGSDLRLEI